MVRFTRFLTGSVVAAALSFGASGATAQETFIFGDAKGCFGACAGGFQDNTSATVNGVQVDYNSMVALDPFGGPFDFRGRTVNGELAVQGTSGNFGTFTATRLGTGPRSFSGLSFQLLLTLFQPTPTAGTPTTFSALLSGNISQNVGTGSLAWNFTGVAVDPTTGAAISGPVSFIDPLAGGRSGTLIFGVYNDNTPSGTPGPITGFVRTTNVVPEPASMVLLGTGLIGLVGVARRRRRKDSDEVA